MSHRRKRRIKNGGQGEASRIDNGSVKEDR